mmetsp:Transcript_21705/g.53830  ORF Transcript_21705/g.53830 Transcript_21705/m.53830 type:complete len:169 (+) Transcript_21705:91-597(+)
MKAATTTIIFYQYILAITAIMSTDDMIASAATATKGSLRGRNRHLSDEILSINDTDSTDNNTFQISPCPRILDPVVCDGVNYNSPCEAKNAGADNCESAPLVIMIEPQGNTTNIDDPTVERYSTACGTNEAVVCGTDHYFINICDAEEAGYSQDDCSTFIPNYFDTIP